MVTTGLGKGNNSRIGLEGVTVKDETLVRAVTKETCLGFMGREIQVKICPIRKDSILML
jgi:hypothetical protein